MYYLYAVFTSLLLALFVAGVVERRRHERNLDSIPIRILVNGIRGKSSITRLIAGALRGGGLRVVAKTTGTAARLINPDASEVPVFRKFGIANVIEQVGIVARAADERPDALVMECMAVQPALQEFNQDVLIVSTIGVISNVRADHLEEMGPSLNQVARSLSRSMPRGGVCVTAERKRLWVLEEEADKRDCDLTVVDPEQVTDEEMARFSYLTFKENVAIALAVAAELGVSRASALRGMYDAPPDPGVLNVTSYQVDRGSVLVANVFAANDPNSTLMNVRQLIAAERLRGPIFTIINCRPDRIERNGQMGSIVADLGTEVLFLIGHPTKSARDSVPAGWPGDVIDLGGQKREPAEIWRHVIDHVDGVATVLAVGNIHGQGERLLEYIASHAVPTRRDNTASRPIVDPRLTTVDTEKTERNLEWTRR